MVRISLEEILSCNLGELTEVLYQHLKEKQDATTENVAEVQFGNANFDGRLIIKLKDPKRRFGMAEEKRFIIPEDMRVIRDTLTGKEAIFYDSEDGHQFREWLNELSDKAEQNKAWGESNARIMFSLGQYLQAYDEILDAFINGIEDEKSIDPNNQEFQEKMNFTLKYLKRLKEEYTNIDDYLKKKKELEKWTKKNDTE